jgi:Flp pilus assembly protein TadG
VPASRQNHSASRKTRKGESGQAVVEFALGILPIVLFVLFGIIDFSRAIYQQQVITGLTRSGSSMAARGGLVAPNLTDQTNIFYILIQGTAPMKLTTYGVVIITGVANNGTTGAPNYQVTAQYQYGTCTGCAAHSSKIGSSTAGSPATLPPLPSGGLDFPQPGQTIYVTEIFYAYQPLTPIGRLIAGLVLPTQSYDVAYI